MLFLLFQLGRERYALEAGQVAAVLPLLNIMGIPQAPRAVAGPRQLPRHACAGDRPERTDARPPGAESLWITGNLACHCIWL